MAEQEKDKTEQATPSKLEEAKRRGQVAKSPDFNSFFVLAGGLGLLYGWGDTFARHALILARSIFEQAGKVEYDPPHLSAWFESVAVATAYLMVPFFLTAILVMVLANLIQTGPIFTGFPLKPDFQRINPVAGFKRVFSLKMLFEGLKSVIKLVLFGLTAYFVLTSLLPGLLVLMNVDPAAYAPLLLDKAANLVFKLLLVVLLIVLIDFTYTRWDFSKKMMMSRREVKEEVKRREGDPHVRAKIRELQQEAAKRSKSLGRVPDADVLITNPTHFAVALRYEQGTMSAPNVIAKGAHETALKMRLMANKHGVPVFERPQLARQLFREGDIDQPVTDALFEQVARVYAELYALRPAQVRLEMQL
jgi:flagellar biosynthetic protein FlhB